MPDLIDDFDINTENKLVLLTLPIGNLKDITSRVKEALLKGKYFYAEDTRNFFTLLNLLEISSSDKVVKSFHDHSNNNEINRCIDLLKQGETVYLVSDAGSPAISDPAYPLIVAVYDAGFKITTYSGPCSIIAALELSGLPTNPFTFHGFLPRDAKKDDLVIEKISSYGTHILFEAPTRVLTTLTFLTTQFPNSFFSVTREISKKFETVYRFYGRDFISIKDSIIQKGEFVILFYNEKSDEMFFSQNKDLEISANDYINSPSPRKLSKLLSQILNQDSKEIYKKLSTTN